MPIETLQSYTRRRLTELNNAAEAGAIQFDSAEDGEPRKKSSTLGKVAKGAAVVGGLGALATGGALYRGAIAISKKRGWRTAAESMAHRPLLHRYGTTRMIGRGFKEFGGDIGRGVVAARVGIGKGISTAAEKVSTANPNATLRNAIAGKLYQAGNKALPPIP